MKKLCHLYNNILIVGILLIVFGPPGAVAHCGHISDIHAHIPHEILALSGSCVDIRCRFDTLPEFDSNSSSYAVWMKYVKNFKTISSTKIYYNSSGSVNTHQMELIGDLRSTNCTTRISDLKASHADKYMFRIQNKGFAATYCEDSVTLTVAETPWAPTIDVSRSNLKERQSVTVSCSAYTPCVHSPPELTWNLKRDSIRQILTNTDGNFTTKIQENITLIYIHDGFNISCSAKYPVTGGFKQSPESIKTLSVSYAPKETRASKTVFSSVLVGTLVNLTCSSRGKPPPTFTWFRKTKDGSTKVSENQVYSFNATERGDYYCEARNDLGVGNSRQIRVDKLDAPKDTKANMYPTGLLRPGTWVELTCSTKAEHPFNFTWFRNNKNGTTKLNNNMIYSFTASPTVEGDYYCEARNSLGSDTSRRLCVDINDTPFIPSINIPVGELKEDQSITITCSVSTPCPQSQPGLTWNLKQDSLRQTEKNTEGTFTTKIQETITLSDKHDGYNIKCSTRHPADLEDKTAEKDKTLSVSYAPKNTSALIGPSSVLSEGNWVELICSSRANPQPYIAWFKKGKEKFTEVSTGKIYNVVFIGGSQYYCVSSNKLGKQRSPTIKLNLKGTTGSLIFALLGVLGMAALGIFKFVLDKWYKQTS